MANMLEKTMINNIFIRKYIALLFAVVLCGGLPFYPAFAQTNEIVFERDAIEIEVKDKTIRLNPEIARTPEQLKHGLMFREKLSDNQTMLFLFDGKQEVSMWMKNTPVSLDMLFIDNTGKIIYIATNTKPNSLDVISAGNAPVKAVLEMRGGLAKALGIAVGDRVVYKEFKQ